MTSLDVHTAVTYLTSIENTWRDQDHKSRIIVKCLKGTDFNGYFIAGGMTPPKRFDMSNRDELFDLCAKVVAEKLLLIHPGPCVLVPVPNSNAFVGSGNEFSFRTHRFATAVAAHAGAHVSPVPALLWKEQKTEQHKSLGSRHCSQFIKLLHVAYKPVSKVVLLDDVITSGSQMLACAHVLRKLGCSVLCGIAMARSSVEQLDDMLNWREERINQWLLPWIG